MLHTRHRRVVLWHRIAPNVRGIVGRNFNWMIVQDIIQQQRLCAMAGQKIQLDDSSGHYAAATVMRNGGAKPQKPTAQGNALGKRVRRCTPHRGKSKCNVLTANCFCPYRTQLLQCTATLGRCPQLCAY
ncbi:hypothetical protein [Hoylesella timonensis]|uniref:hypothetical protein n=1 Tax=Hoylesella timonensis TaxID=386414 RepID=UPI00242A5E81|nr:hypothetical protein [Hoylesella timonensis]